jgi:hypothetical protein
MFIGVWNYFNEPVGFIRFFYFFLLRCMELALIMFLCENSFHARFIRWLYFIVLFLLSGGNEVPFP